MKPLNLVVLATFAALGAVLWAAPAAAQGPDGRTIYLKQCRSCHGATGEPSKTNKAKYPKIKTLADSAFYATRSTDSLTHVVTHGAGKDMKAFADKLTPAEIAAVVAYIQTLPKAYPAKREE